MDNIQVAIRVRPLIAKETNLGQQEVWNVKENTLEPLDQNGKPGVPYTFDRIFDDHMTTYDLFQEIAKPIIDAAVQGFHGTIFAYGQSSSGKTFTMTGSNMQPGIIKLAVNEIFSRINNIPDREYLVRCCYMEIYNEKVSDLLSSEDKIIKIQEDTERNVNVIGVEERYVMNENDLNAVLKEGEARRHMAETKQNDRSSRSHCILRVIIESRQVDDESAVMVAHLNFVDLAGSEKAGENTGDRFREGCSINKSLFTLARIIAKLSEGVSNQHIGYRDSKLTRILQNALGGNSKTAIIATITPASLEESHSTLKFASRAKTISNKPKVNEVLSDAALLKRSRMEIQKLQEKINAMENRDVSELKGEKEDLEKKLREKEEMEQKYHDLLNSLKYVIQSGTTQQKETIPQSKRRKTWCPGKGASISSPRRFSFINRMNFFNEAEEVGIEDISPPHIRKRKSDGKYTEPVEKKHVSFPADPVKIEEDDEAFIIDPLARELLDMQDKYENLMRDYEELKKEKMEMDEYHCLELETNKEGMERVEQLEEKEKNNKEEIEKLRKQLADLEEKFLEKSQTMKSMEDKMNVLSDENFHLEHRLQIQNKKVTEYQSELDGVWKQTEEGEEGNSEVKRLKLTNEQLNSELEKYQSSNEELKSEMEKLKEVQSLQFQEVEKLKSAEGELKEYQATVKTLQSKVHELEMTIKMFEETVQEFQVETKHLQSLVDEKTQELEEQKARTEHHVDNSDQIQEFQQKMKSLEEEIQQHLLEKENLKAKTQDLENTLEKMGDNLNCVKDDKTTDGELENMRIKYDEANRTITELEKKLEDHLDEVRKLSGVREEKQEDFENRLSKRENEKEGRRKSREISKSAQSVRIEELEAELQETTRKHCEEMEHVRKELTESSETLQTVEKEQCTRCLGMNENDNETVHHSQPKDKDVEKLDKSMNVSLEEADGEKENTSLVRFRNDEEIVRLEEKIEELQEKIAVMEQEKENLKDPAELMSQFQNIVEVMKKEHAKEIQKMQEDCEFKQDNGLQDELEYLQNKCQELSQTVNEKEALCEELKVAVTDKEALCVELHEKIMQSGNLVRHQENDTCINCQKYMEEINDSQKQLAVKKEELENLEESIRKFKEENENVHNQKSEISPLQDELKTLQNQLNENECKISRLQEENESLLESANLNQSPRHRSESSSRMNQTQSDSMDYTEMCERLSLENMSLQERVEELQEEVGSLQDQIKHYQQEVECLEDTLKEAQEENKVSQNKMWELEEKLIAQTGQIVKETTESQETQTEDLNVGRPHCEEQASQTEGVQEDTQRGLQEKMFVSDGSQLEVVDHGKSQREEELIQELALLKEQYEGQDQAKSQREEELIQELALLKEQYEGQGQAKSQREEELIQELALLKEQYEGQDQAKSQREEELIQELALLKEQYEGDGEAKSQREETLMQELTSLQSQHEELEEKLQDVTKNWEDAEEKVLELTHCLEVTKEEIDNMTQRLEKSETEVQNYQRQIESLQRSMADMTDQKEHEYLSNQCQELEMKIKTMTNENENLHTTVAEKEKQVSNLKQQICLLEETQMDFQTELQKLEVEKKSLEETVLNQSKLTSVDDQNEKIYNLEEKLEALASENGKLKAEIDEKKKEYAKQEDVLQTRWERVMELSDEVSSVREAMEEVEQSLSSASEEIHGLKLRNLQLESTVREKEGEVSDLQEQCQFLETEVESLRSEVNNLNEELSQALDRNVSSSGQDEIESKIAEKESLISSLQSQLQAVESELKANEEKVKNITSSVQDEVEEKITLKDKEIESLRIQLEALQNKLKAKDADLQLAYNQSISSSGQEEKFQERMNKKEHELQSLQTKLMDLQAQVEKEGVQELHYTISQLESKVEQYSQRNRELQQSLIKLEAGASVPQTLQKEMEKVRNENETLKKERELFQLEEKMKRSKLVSEFNSQRMTIKKHEKTIQELLKELDEVDSKAVEKEVLDKLAREEKENDRLWASIEAKEKEIRHLKGYQSQTVDLAKQVAELERNKKELEAKLRESKKATVEKSDEEIFTPHARELADKKREVFALRMELEKVKDSAKDREQAYGETVDRYEKRISSLKNEIRRLQQDNETSVLVPCSMKKTLFEEPTEKPCNTSSQSNVSSSEAGVSYKASCSGAVDQYSNLLLKNENKRLEKDNKKLVAKLTQLEAELKRYKENRKKSEEKEKISEGKEKMSSVVKKEPLEDSKLTQLDFSIPKAPVSVQVQSGFRKVEPSSKRKELSTEDIDSKDQCATQ
uniref:Kinesin motor domain-containing protein n=1 Tax=Magallana gigas TaxID=29159 RepID=A0A8W8KFP2_MAGGI